MVSLNLYSYIILYLTVFSNLPLIIPLFVPLIVPPTKDLDIYLHILTRKLTNAKVFLMFAIILNQNEVIGQKSCTIQYQKRLYETKTKQDLNSQIHQSAAWPVYDMKNYGGFKHKDI